MNDSMTIEQDGWTLTIQSIAAGHHLITVSMEGHRLKDWSLDEADSRLLRVHLGADPQAEGAGVDG